MFVKKALGGIKCGKEKGGLKTRLLHETHMLLIKQQRDYQPKSGPNDGPERFRKKPSDLRQEW